MLRSVIFCAEPGEPSRSRCDPQAKGKLKLRLESKHYIRELVASIRCSKQSGRETFSAYVRKGKAMDSKSQSERISVSADAEYEVR